MAYKIEPKTVKEFIDMDTSLPRFQRKQTWKPKDNFKLCISVFKDYPVGVVIINNNAGKNWVLDGRQRLNALSKMSKNPREVYDWARSFIGFKNGDADDIVKELYWNKIDDYLQKDFEEDVYDEKGYNKKKAVDSRGNIVTVETEEPEEQEPFDEDDKSENAAFENEHTYNVIEQKNNLNILLRYILMVHNIKGGKSKFERIFNFSSIIKNLDYYKVQDGKVAFVEQNLMELINAFIKKSKSEGNKELITKESFVQYFIEERYIDGSNKDMLSDFGKIVDRNWEDIKNSFDVIDKVNGVLASSRIGIIEITQATDLDAQNMFSLVNTGGTLLTAEEILSAKPFWNKFVDNPSRECIAAVDKLYKILKVEKPDNVVRWDLCATLLSRIDNDGVVFQKYDSDSFAQQTTLGFKLISSLLLGGISSNVVSNLEKIDSFNWDTDYEPLVRDINDLISVISQHDYFKTLKTWKQSIMGITSNTIALEFITIMYKKWCSIGKSIVDSAETKKLRRDAVILLDKLIYEYSNKMWRGSSDSKLAADVKDDNIANRLEVVPYDSWKILLDSMANGLVNDQPCTLNLIKPILFHSKYMKKECSYVSSESYDLDHIYPQKLFKSNKSLDQNMKDSLINIQILSKKANEVKNDKKLNEINELDVIDEIVKSSNIDYESFSKFSDIGNLGDLKELRLEKIKNIFKDDRKSIIDN